VAPSPALLLEHVSKRFADHTAVDDLSLAIPTGVIYGLLGPNGAGKTTTIRMMLGIMLPDTGRIRLLGGAGTARAQSARIGYLPEERGLYRRMRVLDVLVFLAEMKGVDRRSARDRALAWLDRLGLSEWRARRVDDLSKGMQQKVQFISTLLHNPSLVILDEPFAGLDPVNAQMLKDIVLELRGAGITVLLSTHVMEQAEKLCDQLCIIARGRKLVNGSLAEIKRAHGGKHLTIGFDGRAGDAAIPLFGDRRLVRKIDDYGQYAELELTPGADPQELLRGLVQGGVRLSRFELMEPSLHKIFIDLVRRDPACGPAGEEAMERA
jgi:ABC-2 type transport system ATP-binding protein